MQITLDLNFIFWVLGVIGLSFVVIVIYRLVQLKNNLYIRINEVEKERDQYIEKYSYSRDDNSALKKQITDYEATINDFQEQLKEIETLATSKISNTEEAYKNAITSLNNEVEIYQKYMVNISTAIKLADEKIKEIDIKGTFKSDDEIGWFFDSVKKIQVILSEFMIEIQEFNKN